MFIFDAKLSTAIESPLEPGEEQGASAPAPLSAELLDRMHRYWCAANYLCVGQIYLLDNPLLREPLTKDHIKPRLLGHWGTSAGQNFIYVHLNRLIRETDANIIYISGPATEDQRLTPARTSKERIPTCIPKLRRTPTVCGFSFALFLRLAASRVTADRTRPIPCMREANSDIRWCTPLGRLSTILI